MAADWWARGIAIGSAGVTAVNMFISFKTYRRTRPNVDISVEKISLSSFIRDTDKPRKDQYVFLVRFINRGATATAVERVELVDSEHRWSRSGRLIKGERLREPLEVEPLSGAKHHLRVGVGDAVRSQESPHVRVVALLADGTRVHSKRIADFKSMAEE